MKEYYYCEFLFMSEPREQCLSLKECLKRYNAKLTALKSYPMIESGSFLGVQVREGNKKEWIVKNGN